MSRIASRAALSAVVAFVAVAAGAGSPDRSAQADEGVCTVAGVGSVAPLTILTGEDVAVALDLSATCPEGMGAKADIMLLLDRSSSMGEDGKLEAAHTAVRVFVDRVDFTRHRAGLITFNSSAFVLQGLTDRPERLLRALDESGSASQGTDIAEAIDLAESELQRNLRTGAVGVLVLLTDGQSDEESMATAAANSRDNGTVIFAIALGPDADQAALRRVATSAAHLSLAPTPDELQGIYERIAGVIARFSVTDARLTMTLAEGVTYAADSGQPWAPSGARDLTWRLPVIAADPLAMTFGARMRLVGRYAPGSNIRLDYRDGDGVRRQASVGVLPEVEVLPRPLPLFLPVALKSHCLSGAGGVDVALVLDTSDSMSGAKLRDAVAGATAFSRRLESSRDQATVISFDSDARIQHPLTSDALTIEITLAGLGTQPGTRIDRGIELAATELVGPRRRPNNRPVIILLTDGRQDDGRGRVLSAAELSTGAGVTIYTIALGADADQALLAAAAGSPTRAFVAPTAATLDALYRHLSSIVRCR